MADSIWSEFVELEWEKLDQIIIGIIWFIVLLCMKYSIHYLRKLPILRNIPETCWLVLSGTLFGYVITVITKMEYNRLFTPDVFFLYLLPPIIFEAGYYMPRTPFLQNIHTIFTYAFLGTLINAIAIGGSLFYVFKHELTSIKGLDLNITTAILFGSIVAAVDPVAVIATFQAVNVNMLLYICVFGESLFNDGVAVVLAKVFEKLLVFEPEVITAEEVGFFVAELGASGLNFEALVLIGSIMLENDQNTQNRVFENIYFFLSE